MTKLKEDLKLARIKFKLWKDEDSKKEMKEACKFIRYFCNKFKTS